MGKAPITYSFLFINLFLFSTLLNAQEEEQKNLNKDSDNDRGFTIGINFEGPVGRIFDADKSAFSAVTHIKFADDFFFRGEAGFENLTFSSENIEDRNYNYQSNGTFLKAGILYDFFEVEEAGNNDNIFIGLHYGFALQEHGSKRYIIKNGYWNDYTGSQSNYVLNSHWLEITGGPRTEILKNLYMSWTINLRVKLFQDNKNVLQPYSIPGFGSGDNNINAGFSYVIEYYFPWRKK